jgi:hypothetical protein
MTCELFLTSHFYDIFFVDLDLFITFLARQNSKLIKPVLLSYSQTSISPVL